MATNQITVQIHVEVDLDGKPITEILDMPATMEHPLDTKGLHIHLSLDGRKLARALLPHLDRELMRQFRALRPPKPDTHSGEEGEGR